MNRTELKAAVAAYLHRTDLTDKLDGFIALAEAYMFRELHIKEMEISTTGTTSGGYIDLPADFGSITRVTLTYAGTERSLDYVTKQEDYVAAGNVPWYYALETNKIRLYPAPGTGYAYRIYYIPEILPLSATVDTNWLLENASDLYQCSTALEGARYVRNQQEIDKLSGLQPMLLDSVKRFSERRGQPMTGNMQIKPRRKWQNF